MPPSLPSQSLRSELRSLPAAFWVICAGMFINRFGTFIYPFLTIILYRRGYTLGEIGLAVGAFGCGGIGAALAGGWFTDRYGRRNAIAFGTAGQAVFIFLIYLVQWLPLLIVVTALAGFMGGFFHPATSALVADLVPPRMRLRAYSMLRLAVNAGFAFGTATGGLLVNHSAFWLFAGDALTTAAYGVLALSLLPHGLRTAQQQARWVVALRQLRKDKRFWALAAAQFCTSLVFCQLNSTYPLEVTHRPEAVHLFGHPLSPEQIFGALLGLNGVIIVCLELPLTRFTQRFSPRRVMSIGYFLIGGSLTFNAVPGGLAPLVVGMALFTFGEMMVLPTSSAWVAHLAPESMRGRYLGALSLSWSVASIIGPPISLWAYGAHPALPWVGCGLLGVFASLMFRKYGDCDAQIHTPEAPALASASTPD